MKAIALLTLLPLVGLTIFAANIMNTTPAQAPAPKLPANAKTIVLGGGCFWCLDSLFTQVKGVLDVESGFAGGSPQGVSYEEVCTGATGHAEVVKLTYDPNVISASDLLHLFFVSHNPTTLNRQGPDSGTQYRSVIFYSTPEEKQLDEQVRADIIKQKIWRDPIVTTIEPLKNYTRAEEYHQHYYEKFEHASAAERMMMNVGYCEAVIQPKVIEFKKKYARFLKD